MQHLPTVSRPEHRQDAASQVISRRTALASLGAGGLGYERVLGMIAALPASTPAAATPTA